MRIQELANKYRDYLNWFQLTINVNEGPGSCPFRCSYCFLDKDEGKTRNLAREDIIKGIELFKQIRTKKRKPHIHFFGTEPLMRFDLIEFTRTLVPEDIPITITTNGYLINKKMIETMEKKNIRISILSFDAIYQDVNRRTIDGKPTREIVLKNYFMLPKEHRERITMRGTITPLHHDLVAMYKDYHKFTKNATVVPDITVGGWDEEAFASDIMKLADFYKGGESACALFNRTLSYMEKGITGRSFCVLGKGALTLGPDGGLYLCHHLPPNLKLTDIYTHEVNIDVMKFMFNNLSLGDHITESEICKNCPAKSVCPAPGACPQHFYEITGSYWIPSENYCTVARAFATGFKYWLSLRHTNKINADGKTVFQLKSISTTNKQPQKQSTKNKNVPKKQINKNKTMPNKAINQNVNNKNLYLNV